MLHVLASLLVAAVVSNAGELSRIKVTQFEVPPTHALANPDLPMDVSQFRDGDSIYHLQLTKRLPDGRSIEYDLKREVHLPRAPGQAEPPSPPSPATPPSTAAKVANGLGVTIFIYEVVDQTTRTAKQTNDTAKRLRHMAEHGIKVAQLSAAEQRAAAAEKDRASERDFSKSKTNAAITSGRLNIPTPILPPEPVDPATVCRGPDAHAEFSRARDAGDAGRLAQFVGVALGDEDSACRALVPEVTNGDSVLDTRKIESRVPESPLDTAAFAMPAGTVVGREMRNLANGYQVEWIGQSGYRDEPGRRELFNSGTTLLGAADDAYVRGEVPMGHALQTASRITLDILKGAVDGVKEAAGHLYHQLPVVAESLVRCAEMKNGAPIGLAKESFKMVMGIPKVAHALYTEVIKDYHVLKDGSAYDRSRLISREVALHAAYEMGGRMMRATGAGIEVATAGARAAAIEKGAAESLARYGEHVRGQWMAPLIDEAKVSGLAKQLRAAEHALVKSGATVTKGAREFMASGLANGAVTNAELSTETVLARGREYLRLESKLADVPLTKFEAEVTRGIPREYHLNIPESAAPVVFEATEKSVMRYTHHSYLASNRFGAMGQVEMYGTVGVGREVYQLIAKETGRGVEELVFATQRMSLNGVLNLTEKANLIKLGLTEVELKTSEYALTQALGHLARARGITGIIFSSTHNVPLTNLVVF